jgi:phospholipase C
MGLENIEYIFVLMMENRSFDHMLGFSGNTGADALTGQPTQAEGLPSGGCSNNDTSGNSYSTASPAPFMMPEDPDHEFDAVQLQLLGSNAATVNYHNTAVTNSGFVKSYQTSAGSNPLGDIMKGFDPGQLPVLNALAKEFCLCDRWFSSLPGPTLPNRFFLHAATSGGDPTSPSTFTLARAVVDGDASYKFVNGNIFQRLTQWAMPWGIYHGDIFAMVYALDGVSFGAGKYIDPSKGNTDTFFQDLQGPNLPKYIFIEPDWGNMLLGTYKGGNSQHPVDDVTSGEKLIKFVYESLRGSSYWEKSALIITYDEHGGFFDHVLPPGGVAAPGDVPPKYGFDFTQLGVRVPALVISPWIPKNLIDHTVYDHTTVLATLREWLQTQGYPDIGYFTERDKVANDLAHLFSLSEPRPDTPPTLPDAANSGVTLPAAQSITTAPETAFASFEGASQPVESTQAGFVQIALKHHLQVTPKSEHHAILQRVKAIQNRGQAKLYLRDVKVALDRKLASKAKGSVLAKGKTSKAKAKPKKRRR